MPQRQRLGDLLLAHRLITEEQLDDALAIQARDARPLGAILIERGYVDKALMLRALAAQRHVRYWDFDRDAPAPEALDLVPPRMCRRYHLLPVERRGDLLMVAMRQPDDLDAIDLVRNVTKLRVEPLLADEAALDDAIAQHHGATQETNMSEFVSRAMREVKEDEIRLDGQGEDIAEDDMRPVVGLVNQLITDAIRMKASDIHIEPRAGAASLRLRIDGELVRTGEIPAKLMPMVVTRIKIMAKLDIVEFRVPQDGRIRVNLDGRGIDLRVSVLPNHHGQRLVMRILDQATALKKLDQMGFHPGNLEIFRSLIQKPYGMILVTGPTGSGKTTTLYGALNELKRVGSNIMTCEDPVEYDLEGINQSQVNDKVGLTFALQLRAILRQDPDIVLVGEIRDQETAQTAIRAAMTGHLVLSTLHCNDAPSAVPRLLDMGVDPFLLSTSLIGVMSQRLVRKLCPECRRQGAPTAEEVRLLNHYLGEGGVPLVWRTGGCAKCANTGIVGRMAVHEVMPITPEVGKKIAACASMDELRDAASRYGYRTMQHDALDRVVSGTTSIDEAKRLIYFDTFTASGEWGSSTAEAA